MSTATATATRAGLRRSHQDEDATCGGPRDATPLPTLIVRGAGDVPQHASQ